MNISVQQDPETAQLNSLETNLSSPRFQFYLTKDSLSCFIKDGNSESGNSPENQN